METIQLRISKKRFFVVPKTLPFPGFFVSFFGLTFSSHFSFNTRMKICLVNTSHPPHNIKKNAHTSKRHAKICCAQNYYGDCDYYY